VELGISDADFWRLTPRDYRHLIDAAKRREDREQARVGLHLAHWANITSGYMANVANMFAPPKSGSHKPQDFMPDKRGWQPHHFLPGADAPDDDAPQDQAANIERMKQQLKGLTIGLGGEVRTREKEADTDGG
jgi:hypothetical protein